MYYTAIMCLIPLHFANEHYRFLPQPSQQQSYGSAVPWEAEPTSEFGWFDGKAAFLYFSRIEPLVAQGLAQSFELEWLPTDEAITANKRGIGGRVTTEIGDLWIKLPRADSPR